MAASRTFSGSITKTQLWSRKAMGDLWAQRESLLSAEETVVLDKLYKSRKGTGLQQCQTVSYKTASSRAGSLGYGRLYSTGGFGLEKVNSEIRATLCRDIYHDLDIVNCQPTILRHMAAHYGRTLPVLELYVGRRDAFLEELQAQMECARNVAKLEVLKVLYGGGTSVGILRSLSAEIRDFARFLATTDDWSELYSVSPTDDKLFSFLSHVLGTEERRCLLTMNDYMTAKGWQVDVLAYDGFMVRKRLEHPITEELLVGIADAVKVATGYDIKVMEKEMASLLSETPAPVINSTDAAYATLKTKFEEDHFYFVPTDTVIQVTPKYGIRHFGLEHARNAFNTEEWILAGAKDDDTFIKRWLKDPKRRKVASLVYKHQKDCGPDEASLFTGFAYEHMTGEDPTAVPLFLDMLEAICGDEEPVMKYVAKWFAHIIQHPFDIPGTALIFTSHTHGTGKDTVIGTMSKIIGRHARMYTSDTHFWDKHDTGKEGALLLHLQEAGAAANKAKAGELKALVTATSVSVNPKGLRGYEVPNMARIVMTTNEPDPLKLEESDRRFVLMQPSDRLHARGLDWWASIQPQINSEAFLGTVGRWLETHCLHGWNPRQLPMTNVKEELLELAEPTAKQFLEAMIEEAGDNPPFMTGTELFKKYKTWAASEEMDTRFLCTNSKSLGIKIRSYKGKLFDKIRSAGGNLYRPKVPVPLQPAGGAGTTE
jgi:hypothetical protein